MVTFAADFAVLTTQQTDPEVRFLADCVAAQVMQQPAATHAATHAATPDATPDATPLNGHLLTEIARLHKLTLFLPRTPAYLPAGCERVPGIVDQIRLRTLQMNHQSLTAASEVADVLTRAGIAHMHFKGPLQQVALYGNLLRKPVGDADVLVAKADHLQACKLLEAAGYVSTDQGKQKWWTVFLGEVHLRKHGTGPMVDLHQSLQQSGLPSPYRPELFTRRAVDMDYSGRTYHVASSADRCLIAAISVTKALYSQEPCGASATDLWAAWRSLSLTEREKTVNLAQLHGLQTTLALAVRTACAMYGPPALADFTAPTVPAPLRQMIGPQGIVRTLGDADLARLGWQPWRNDGPRLRRRTILTSLCAGEPLRLARESLQLAASELYRRGLERMARAPQNGAAP
jgi:hypothetical protein